MNAWVFVFERFVNIDQEMAKKAGNCEKGVKKNKKMRQSLFFLHSIFLLKGIIQNP